MMRAGKERERKETMRKPAATHVSSQIAPNKLRKREKGRGGAGGDNRREEKRFEGDQSLSAQHVTCHVTKIHVFGPRPLILIM